MATQKPASAERSGIQATVRDDPRLWWLGLGLVVLGLGMGANSVLGPLLIDSIDYPVSETMRNQTIGLDAATLAVVAPISVVIGVLVLRGHRVAQVLALGPTSYAAYMFVQYIAGPDHLDYPNVLLLQLGVFVGGWTLAAAAWMQHRSTAEHGTTLGRRHGYASWVLAGFVLLRYLPGLIGSLSAEPLPAQAVSDPAMYWLIVLLDLGVYVPVAVVAGVGLRRRWSWASTLHRGAVGWFTLVTIAVGFMSATMIINDDVHASTGQFVLFVVTGLMVAGYAYIVHRPLFERSPTHRPRLRLGTLGPGESTVRERIVTMADGISRRDREV